MARPSWDAFLPPPYSAALRCSERGRDGMRSRLERPRELDHLGGKRVRGFRGEEMTTGKEAQLGAKELRERAGDGVDGQVAVRLSPEHKRGHAGGAKRVAARSGLARIESARCPD